MTDFNQFNFDAALALLESTHPFPVDFDAAWQWLGYSSKQKARDKLINNFEKGLDYTIDQDPNYLKRSQGGVYNRMVKNPPRSDHRDDQESFEFSGLNRKTPQGGRPSESIKLSIDCFKSFCMMAGTEKGKEVRRYFLKCERSLKEILLEPSVGPDYPLDPKLENRLASIESRLQRLEQARSNPAFLLPRRRQPAERISQYTLVLDLLNQHRGERFSAQEIAELLNIPHHSVRRVLSVLCRKGLVDQQFNSEYTGSKGIPKHFYLTGITL